MYTEDDKDYREKHHTTSINNNDSNNYYHAYYDNTETINNKKIKKESFLTRIINKFKDNNDDDKYDLTTINHKKHIVIVLILVVVLAILSVILIQTIFIKHPPSNSTKNYVRLLEESINLKIGDVHKLDVVLSDSNANYRLEWFSNNDNIVTVDSNGTVVALKEGEAIILVAYYVDNKVYDAQCIVKVLR